MSEINVQTWTDLAYALSATYADSDLNITINITKDIDCNYEIPEGVTQSVQLTSGTDNSSTRRYLTVNGNGHEIRNLRSSIVSPVDIFRRDQNIRDAITYTFNDLKFINLILTGGAMLYRQVRGSAGREAYIITAFNRCGFVGRRETSLFYFGGDTSGYNWTFTSCYFYVPNIAATLSTSAQVERMPIFYPSSSDRSASMNFCWIREQYMGQARNGSSYDTFATNNMKLNGCYIDGEFVAGGASGIQITNQYSYESAIQNVVDAKLMKKDGIDQSFECRFPKGIFRSEITDYVNPDIRYTDYTYNSPKAIAIPPEYMTDPAYMYEHGFDVIVPE